VIGGVCAKKGVVDEEDWEGACTTLLVRGVQMFDHLVSLQCCRYEFHRLDCHMGLQAKFNFTFTTPSDMVALFNTAEDATAAVAEAKGMTSHRYDLSPPMSTYLVAFIVGRLSSVSLITQGQPRNISVWGTPDRCGPPHARVCVCCEHVYTLSMREHMCCHVRLRVRQADVAAKRPFLVVLGSSPRR
jgi:hypothetical protein